MLDTPTKKKGEKKDYNESLVTKGAISPGTQLCQTWNSQPDLEDLAKKWATKLPRCFTWEKLQKKKSPASSKKWELLLILCRSV